MLKDLTFYCRRYALGGLVAISTSFCLMAIPAKPGVMKFTQPDGSVISVRLLGDENYHYYVSADDGRVLERVGDEFRDAVQRPQKAPSSQMRRVNGLVASTTFPALGQQKAVVVLVEYQDEKFNLENPLDYFSRMLNEEGFSDYWATGSARDFFIHSSDGKFIPTFDVYGPVTLQKNREYYGGNDAYGQDNAPQKMVIEACRQLNPTVDFSQYDRDGDGVIDNVFVVYAGRGEASGGASDCVWPHAWTLASAEPGSNYTFDGVKLNRYACVNEWEVSDMGRGYRPSGIGSFVHEFSHVMGLPDLYSTSYENETFTPGAWSALDYGPYNNDGCTPPQYSLYERVALGYSDPEVISGKLNLKLDPVESGDGFIYVTENPNEYFLFENRQQCGWDEFIPGHGMLVWHVDYDEEKWRTNSLNNDPAHNYVDIIEADDIQTEETRGGDCFPGTAGVSSLSDNTIPALRAWNGKSLGIVLTDIRERGKRIVMRLNGGSDDIAAPEALAASAVKAGGFTANWRAVDGAEGYTLKIYERTDSGNLRLDSISITDGNRLSYTISGLVPSRHYCYCVMAEDGFYGSDDSNIIDVLTLDPTFDYFAPVATDATGVTDSQFTANWEAMSDATEYYLHVYSEFPGEPQIDTVDFSAGTEILPSGWSASSKDSYGMSSYCGDAAPSLRIAQNDGYIQTVCYDEDIVGLSFWHRGNSTSDKETLTVSLLSAEGNLLADSVVAVVSDKGGVIIALDEVPAGTRQARILFNRPVKGSVAIDDIKVKWGVPMIATPEMIFTVNGSETSFNVTGLESDTPYYYYLIASDGLLESLRSETVKVTTATPSGAICEIGTDNDSDFNVRIVAGRLSASHPVSIYNIAGRKIVSDVFSAELPSPGFYIVISEHSGEIRKFVIK